MRSIKRTEYIYHIKSLLLLGLPIIIGQLGNIITGLADTVMVGQHSTEELAAASFVNNVINAFIILGTGFSFNYTPIIGENIAVNKRIAIGGWLKNSLMANFTTTISILIVLLLIYTNIELLKQPDELMPLIKPYYIVLLLFIAVFVKQKKYLPFRKGFLVTPFRKAYWKRLNLIGWPIAFQQGIEAATFCITTIMIGWLGGMELAAHQVAIAISTVSFTIYLGLGSAVAIRTSMFKGLQDWEKVRHVTAAGVILAIITSITLSIILLCCCDTIGNLFTDDESVSEIVAILIPILIAYQFGDSIQIVLANALRGLSDVTSIMIISFISYFIVAIPSGYSIAFFLGKGIAGIWMSYPIGFTCAVLLLGYRAFHIMNFKRK